MTPTREPSLGEVAEDIQQLTRAVDALKDTIEKTYVRQDVYQQRQLLVDSRLNSVSRIAMWALGLVCGLVIASLVAFVAQVGGAA